MIAKSIFQTFSLIYIVSSKSSASVSPIDTGVHLPYSGYGISAIHDQNSPKIFLIGGAGAGSKILQYDVAKNKIDTWGKFPDDKEYTGGSSTWDYEGNVYYVGGYDISTKNPSATVWHLDQHKSKPIAVGRLSKPVWNHCSFVHRSSLHSNMLTVGGSHSGPTSTRPSLNEHVLQYYVQKKESCMYQYPLHMVRTMQACTEQKGKLYLISGSDPFIQSFLPGSISYVKWVEPRLPQTLSEAAAIVKGDWIYLFGGYWETEDNPNFVSKYSLLDGKTYRVQTSDFKTKGCKLGSVGLSVKWSNKTVEERIYLFGTGVNKTGIEYFKLKELEHAKAEIIEPNSIVDVMRDILEEGLDDLEDVDNIKLGNEEEHAVYEIKLLLDFVLGGIEKANSKLKEVVPKKNDVTPKSSETIIVSAMD